MNDTVRMVLEAELESRKTSLASAKKWRDELMVYLAENEEKITAKGREIADIQFALNGTN